jgi:flagellar biosynthesis protein FliR
MDPGELIPGWGEENIAGFFLVLARLSPLFMLAPLFSSRMLPMQAKVVAALGMTIGISPLVVAQAPADWLPTEPLGFAGLVLKELLVGMAFSYSLAALFAAISVAGSLIDTMIGFSYGALVDPVTGNQSTVISQLYGLVGLGVFIAINGDAWMIRGLDRTYDLVPLADAPQLGSLIAGTQAAFAGVMGSAVQVAAPIILALVITDTAFGVVSRVVPQLNVFAVGFPAKAAVGMVLIGASLPFVAAWLGDGLQGSVSDALRSLKAAG